MDLAFDPFNENRIASASEDCRVCIWTIPDGGLTKTYELDDALVSIEDIHVYFANCVLHFRAGGLLPNADGLCNCVSIITDTYNSQVHTLKV